MKPLVVDVGGNHVKCMLPGSDETRKIKSGRHLRPGDMAAAVLAATHDWRYDAVALGLPCRVVRGRPVEEPYNLADGWVEFDYSVALDKAVRILNDADLQALGSYTGGRMLFLSFGTSVGSTLIADRVIISLALGQLHLDQVGEAGRILGDDGLERLGKGVWNRAVFKTVEMLRGALLADEVVVGGGNAKLIDPLPEGVRRGDNRNALAGGIRLWNELPDPAGSPDQNWRLA